MYPVKAPEGFEACTYYNDGTRCYDVAYRAIGDTWWTVCCHDAGHAYHIDEERQARAEASVLHTLKVKGLVK